MNENVEGLQGKARAEANRCKICPEKFERGVLRALVYDNVPNNIYVRVAGVTRYLCCLEALFTDAVSVC